VRVLGTVQDGGLPHAACEHGGCQLVRDGLAPKRFVSSLALILPETRQVYLFDATPDLREQLDALRDVRSLPADRVDRAPVDGVFLTHAHIGHYLGLAFFGFEAVHTTALPVWATPRMSRFLTTNGPWSQLVETGNIALQPLPLGRAVELAGGVSVTAFAVPHRDEFSDTVGFRITGPNRTLLFVPDTDKWATWEPSLIDRLAGVDVALLDGSFFSAAELPGRDVTEIGHPMIGKTMDLLQERVTTGSLEALFIHLNHSNPALLPDSVERHEIDNRGFAVAQERQEFAL
jgi:pyrroloquinoline quinone biosynthesis protein B